MYRRSSSWVHFFRGNSRRLLQGVLLLRLVSIVSPSHAMRG